MGLCPKCGKSNGKNDNSLCWECYSGRTDAYKNGPKMVGAVPQQKPQQHTESQTIHYSFTGYFKKHWYRNGNLYSGYMQDGYRHGKGKWTRATDKYTYDGDWYMGKRQGHGKEEMPGQWRFEGEFYDNKRNGFGRLVCADGEVYEGGWKDDKKHGYGKYTRATDKYTYDGDWYMSKRQGHGKEEMPGQWRFEGEFYDNKRNGFGRLVCADGEVYEGGWKDDKKHGYGKMTSADGNRYEGEYFDGKHCGKGMYYNAARNETYEGEFRDGKLNGYAVARYGDGRVYEGTFTDNSKTGNGKQTAPDGTVTLGHWEDHRFVVDSVLRGGEDAGAKETAPEPKTAFPAETVFGEDSSGPDGVEPIPEDSVSEPEEKEFDMSPEGFAAFMKSGAAAESEPEAAPAAELMHDFRKRFLYFDQALYGIDKNGVLHVSSRMKKNQEVIEAYSGRDVSGFSCYEAQNIIILSKDGHVLFADSTWKKGLLADKEIKALLPEVQNWSGLSAVACGSWHFVGLRTDGTVIGAGKKLCHLEEVSRWKSIKAIACCCYGTVGLCEDGTVVSCGFPKEAAKELAAWTEITDIACGEQHVVGLRADGTVVACGKNSSGQCDVSGLCHVGMISASVQCTALMLNDGTVKALGKYNDKGLGFPDIVAAACFNFGAIITLDKDGFLHGDMSGVNTDDFQKDMEW